MKKNSTWNDIIKPVVVLTAICVVVSGVLAFANKVTTPIIARNAQLAADAGRMELLPDATEGFDLVESDMDGVVEVYKAKNGAGYVITSFGKGYGGNIEYMIAFDNDGKIVNLKVSSHNETPGKFPVDSFVNSFIGTAKEVTKNDVDMISGSTISSNASLEAVNNARKAFNQYAKGIVAVELTLEEKLGLLFGEGTPAAQLTEEYSHPDAVEFWQTEKGIIIVTEGKGNGIIGDEHTSGKYLKAYVAFNADGTIAGVYYDDSSETKGLGTKISEEPFISIFNGKTNTDGVDIIADVTYSSKGAIEAVGKAVDVFAAIQ